MPEGDGQRFQWRLFTDAGVYALKATDVRKVLFGSSTARHDRDTRRVRTGEVAAFPQFLRRIAGTKTTIPMKTQLIPAFLAAALLTAQSVMAAEQTDIGQADRETLEKVFAKKAGYSPYAGRNFPTRPLFGDTHLHTSFSIDAGAFGCRLSPRDAYRFARGEEITASSGQPVKLSRPLD